MASGKKLAVYCWIDFTQAKAPLNAPHSTPSDLGILDLVFVSSFQTNITFRVSAGSPIAAAWPGLRQRGSRGEEELVAPGVGKLKE